MLGEALDVVGGIEDGAAVVADGEVGMVVGGVGDPGGGVDEGDRFVIVFEGVGFLDGRADARPAGEGFKGRFNLELGGGCNLLFGHMGHL